MTGSFFNPFFNSGELCSFTCESFMADRTGLGSTTLHYVAVWQVMVSVHRSIHSKITLTCSLTHGKLIIKHQGSKALLMTSKTSEWAPTKNTAMWYCNYMNGHIKNLPTLTQFSPLYLLSTFYVLINYSRLSTAFPYCK